MGRQQSIVNQQLEAMGLKDSTVTLCIHDRNAEFERKALITEAKVTTNKELAEALRKEAEAIKTTEIRTVKSSDLMEDKYMRFLSAQNSNGKDLWIAPERNGKSDLVLVDDIDRGIIDRMKKDGLKPACAVETSPGNYQVWFRVEGMQASPESRSAIARQITKEYGADVGSVGRDHLGRLAGFTNRKPCHEQANGNYPFSRIHESTGTTIKASDSPKVREVLEGAVAYLREQKLVQDNILKETSLKKESTSGMKNIDKWWEITQEKIAQKSFKNFDRSTVDFSMCKMAFAHGATREQVADALLKHSPDIELRKAGHVNDYINKTVDNAIKASSITPTPTQVVTFDRDLADLTLCKIALERGATREQVSNALLTTSPDIKERKGGHLDEYVEKTLDSAYKTMLEKATESLDKNRTLERTASLSR